LGGVPTSSILEGTCPPEVEKLIKSLQANVDYFHTHSATCGHPRVIHGDHVDFLVDGRLHHPHGSHCDDHGAIQSQQPAYFC